MSASPSKTRTRQMNRRQRKKLHVGEFKQLGFTLAGSFRPQAGTYDAFLDEFLVFAETRKLLVGGSFSAKPGDDAGLDLLVQREGIASCDDGDRQAMLDWLGKRPEVETVTASGLIDAWYDYEFDH